MTMVLYKHWGVGEKNKKSVIGCAKYVLQLKKDKTKIIVFGAKAEWLNVSAQIQSLMFMTTNKARNIGVVVDSWPKS